MALERDRAYTSLAAYRALPEGHYDLIEGELFVTPSPTYRHQVIKGTAYRALFAHAQAHQAGWVLDAPLDVTLVETEPPVVVQPDVLFLARAHGDRIVQGGVDGPPDLVVEIVSPGSMRLDGVRKREHYERHGVQPSTWP
jgi:Uma2 family endonuclease